MQKQVGQKEYNQNQFHCALTIAALIPKDLKVQDRLRYEGEMRPKRIIIYKGEQQTPLDRIDLIQDLLSNVAWKSDGKRLDYNIPFFRSTLLNAYVDLPA
jgi:hypothetical protein